MKTTLIFLLSIYTTTTFAQTKKIKFLRVDDPSKNKPVWIKEDGNNVSLEILKFRGGCCDSPWPEMMNAEIAKDTLYIDKVVEKHTKHDEIGICGITIKVIIDKKQFPNYNKLIVVFKELPSTKKRRVPNIK